MNISGIIGFVLAIGLVVWGITTGGELGGFWDPASVAIVVGGTIGALVFIYPLSVLTKVPKMLKVAFFPTKYDPDKYINDLVEYCKTARM